MKFSLFAFSLIASVSIASPLEFEDNSNLNDDSLRSSIQRNFDQMNLMADNTQEIGFSDIEGLWFGKCFHNPLVWESIVQEDKGAYETWKGLVSFSSNLIAFNILNADGPAFPSQKYISSFLSQDKERVIEEFKNTPNSTLASRIGFYKDPQTIKKGEFTMELIEKSPAGIEVLSYSRLLTPKGEVLHQTEKSPDGKLLHMAKAKISRHKDFIIYEEILNMTGLRLPHKKTSKYKLFSMTPGMTAVLCYYWERHKKD